MGKWVWRDLAAFLGTVVALAGCESIRLHDSGRLEMAKETATLAAALSTESGGVFAPMEENLDAVWATQTKLRRLTDQHELDTFRENFNRLGPDRIATRIVESLESRDTVMRKISADQAAAMRAVNEGLDRQELISKVLNDKPAAGFEGNVGRTLARVDGRLTWVAAVIENVKRVQETAGARPPSGPSGGEIARVVARTSGRIADEEKVLREVVAAADKALGRVKDDERVSAAVQLVRRAAEEAAAAEEARLLELRRYVSEVSRLGDRLVVRDKTSVCNLVPTAFRHLYSAVSNTTTLDSVFQKLQASRRYECLDGIQLERVNVVHQRWQGQLLAGYVAADIAASTTTPSTAPGLVAALGILAFHERAVFDLAELELARAAHRHSIRLSRVNAQQRIDLVHQLSAGLEIYYRGGIKPETVAELILFAGQVGALYTIGAQ
jgi:hypothetical protein